MVPKQARMVSAFCVFWIFVCDFNDFRLRWIQETAFLGVFQTDSAWTWYSRGLWECLTIWFYWRFDGSIGFGYGWNRLFECGRPICVVGVFWQWGMAWIIREIQTRQTIKCVVCVEIWAWFQTGFWHDPDMDPDRDFGMWVNAYLWSLCARRSGPYCFTKTICCCCRCLRLRSMYCLLLIKHPTQSFSPMILAGFGQLGVAH